MASLSDFRRVADDVRNWGRWGDDDELGTLNFITAEKVAQAAGLVRHGKVFPARRRLRLVGPAGRVPVPAEPDARDDGRRRRCATRWREYGPEWLRNPAAAQLSGYFEDGPLRFNDDMIIMPLQAATQWDALSHVYYEDKLYNGFPAELGDQPRRVPLRHRQGRRQGHHLARCAARHRAAPRRGDLPRTRQPDHPGRTRRGGPGAGRHDRARRHRAGPHRLVGTVSADRRRRRARRRAWTGRARPGCTTTRSPRSPPTT